MQAIMDLACPQLVFNRTILMGDASFVIRPHTAASTSKGIANAFALVGELAGKQELSESLDHWQRSELNRGQRLMSYGQGLGRSQGRYTIKRNGRSIQRHLLSPHAPSCAWTWTDQCRQMSLY